MSNQIDSYRPISSRTANRYPRLGNVHIVDMMNDYAQMIGGAVDWNRAGKSTFTINRPEGDRCGVILLVTCPECGKRFADVTHDDSQGAITICALCGKTLEY
jgi:hypothetical protein